MSIAYTDFRSALMMRESSGNYQVVNPYGYLGAYQFGEGALIDLGYVINDGNWQNNDYSGGWTGLNGVTSTADFLNTPAVQDLAADAWFPLMWSYLVGVGAQSWLGRTVDGITLTASGLIAGAHLLGQHVVMDWLTSGGSVNPVDQFGTPVSEYIHMFNGYVMPFDTGEPALAAFGALLDTLSDTLRARVEAIYDGAGHLSLAASAIASSLGGTDGNDIFLGQDGDDWFSGLKSADALFGNDGNDTLIAGGGNDVALGGTGDDRMFGGAGNDLLIAGIGADRVLGDLGDDRLFGNGGRDLLAGGDGDDRLFGGIGNDRLEGNVGRDLLVGGAGNDLLLGGLGNDVLRGLDGNDRLAGGPGNDWLDGGAGADVFVLTNNRGTDRVADFDPSEGDRIDLRAIDGVIGFNDLVHNHAEQVGADVVITAGTDMQMILLDTVLGALASDDFLFS